LFCRGAPTPGTNGAGMTWWEPYKWTNLDSYPRPKSYMPQKDGQPLMTQCFIPTWHTGAITLRYNESGTYMNENGDEVVGPGKIQVCSYDTPMYQIPINPELGIHRSLLLTIFNRVLATYPNRYHTFL